MHRSIGIALGLLLLAAQMPLIAGIDPASLRLTRTSEEVRLMWVGDGPGFVVHRSDNPSTASSTVNAIASSTVNEYVDTLGVIPCATCYYLVQAEAAFVCGNLQCSVERQYCFTFIPGVPESSPQYQCLETPDECLPDPACPCVQSAIADEWPLPAGDCVQDDDGSITISVYAP